MLLLYWILPCIMLNNDKIYGIFHPPVLESALGWYRHPIGPMMYGKCGWIWNMAIKSGLWCLSVLFVFLFFCHVRDAEMQDMLGKSDCKVICKKQSGFTQVEISFPLEHHCSNLLLGPWMVIARPGLCTADNSPVGIFSCVTSLDEWLILCHCKKLQKELQMTCS